MSITGWLTLIASPAPGVSQSPAEALPTPATLFEAGRAQEDAGDFEAALESYQDLSAHFPTSRQARHAERRRQWLNQRRDGSEPWEQLRALQQARRQPEPINQEHAITRLADSCDAQKPLCLELRRFVAESLLESGQPARLANHSLAWAYGGLYSGGLHCSRPI